MIPPVHADTRRPNRSQRKPLVAEVHKRTLKILSDHREAFEKVAGLLLEKEVIFADDLEAILGPKVKASEA